MPPKKDDKAKGAEGEEPEGLDEDIKEIMERELLINHLKNKLGRYQEQGENLMNENRMLLDEVEAQKLNLKDIQAHLTEKLGETSKTCHEQEKQLNDLHQQLKEQQEKFDDDMEKLKKLHTSEKETMEEEMREIKAQAEALSEFANDKDKMTLEINDLKSMLVKERKENEDKISDLERRMVQVRPLRELLHSHHLFNKTDVY